MTFPPLSLSGSNQDGSALADFLSTAQAVGLDLRGLNALSQLQFALANLQTQLPNVSGAGVFNVQDPRYGARGNGTKDDTTAIQRAVTAAINAGGGTVYFPPCASYYKLTDKITVGSNLTFLGSGWSSQIKQTVAEKQTFYGTSVDNVTFQNLYGYGQGGWSSSWVDLAHYDRGIDLRTATNVRVLNCTFRNYALSGVWLEAVTGFMVLGNQIEGTNLLGAPIGAGDGFQFGIVAIGAFTTGVVAQNAISEAAFGIDCGDGSGLVIAANNVHDIPGQHGMYVGTSDTVIVGNRVTEFTHAGIKVYSGVATQQNVSVTGNTIASSVSVAQQGVLASGGNGFFLTDFAICSNAIRNTSATPTVDGLARGIDVSACNRGVVVGNQIAYPLQHGIDLNNTDVMTDMVVDGNQVNSPAQYGVLVLGSLTRGTISNNRISGGTASGDGVFVGSGDDVVVRGNDITGAYNYGVRNDTTTNVRVLGNMMSGYTTDPAAVGTAVFAQYSGNNDGKETTSYASGATVKPYDRVLMLDGTGGAFNMTLLDATKMKGQRITLVKIDASGNAVGFAGAGGQTVNGAATVTTTTRWATISIISDGANWVSA